MKWQSPTKYAPTHETFECTLLMCTVYFARVHPPINTSISPINNTFLVATGSQYTLRNTPIRTDTSVVRYSEIERNALLDERRNTLVRRGILQRKYVLFSLCY